MPSSRKHFIPLYLSKQIQKNLVDLGLIIWEKTSMMTGIYLTMTDISCKDLLSLDILFERKFFLFDGDFCLIFSML